jgi:hypothetical protein
MEQAVRNNCKVLSFVQEPLATNFEFVSACIDDNISCLAAISAVFIDRFPDYVMSKLGEFAASFAWSGFEFSCFELALTIRQRLADCPDLATAWFDAGLPVLGLDVFDDWRNDRDLFLKIAAWRNWSSQKSFYYLGDVLRDDADFMMKAVAVDPTTYVFASTQLKQENYELAMQFLATQKWHLHHHLLCSTAQHRRSFLRRGQAELVQFDTFMNPFLCGLHFAEQRTVTATTPITTTTSTNTSSFAALHQYTDLKCLIADFVGVPRGRLLRNIREAVECHGDMLSDDDDDEEEEEEE